MAWNQKWFVQGKSLVKAMVCAVIWDICRWSESRVMVVCHLYQSCQVAA
jgi:hypothetical protein